MLSSFEIFIILILNPIVTAMIVYFVLGNRLLGAFKRFLRAKNANMAKQSKAKPSNSGNMILDIIGSLPPEVIGGLAQKFLMPKDRPPKGNQPF